MRICKAGIFVTLCCLLFTGQASADFVTPCVKEADYSYQSERISVAIDFIQTPATDTEKELAYFVADVQLSSPNGIRSALNHDKPKAKKERVSVMAARHEAVLAINADYYSAHESGLIIRDGVVLRARKTARHLLIIEPNGDFTVKNDRKGEKTRALAEELLARGVRDTYEFGPVLVQNGEIAQVPKGFKAISTRDTTREPRTAIGQIGPLHYVVIVADGRREGYSLGMTLPKLRQLFIDYGAHTAFNMDGGGSTTLYFNGEVINQPSNKGERGLSDILYFK